MNNPYIAPENENYDSALPVGLNNKLKTFFSPEDLAESLMEFYDLTGLFRKNIFASYKIQIIIGIFLSLISYYRTSSFISAAVTLAAVIIFGLGASFLLLPITKQTNRSVFVKRLKDEAGDFEYQFLEKSLILERSHMRCEFDYEIFRNILIGKKYVHLIISESRAISFRNSEIKEDTILFLKGKIHSI